MKMRLSTCSFEAVYPRFGAHGNRCLANVTWNKLGRGTLAVKLRGMISVSRNRSFSRVDLSFVRLEPSAVQSFECSGRLSRLTSANRIQESRSCGGSFITPYRSADYHPADLDFGKSAPRIPRESFREEALDGAFPCARRLVRGKSRALYVFMTVQGHRDVSLL